MRRAHVARLVQVKGVFTSLLVAALFAIGVSQTAPARSAVERVAQQSVPAVAQITDQAPRDGEIGALSARVTVQFALRRAFLPHSDVSTRLSRQATPAHKPASDRTTSDTVGHLSYAHVILAAATGSMSSRATSLPPPAIL